MTDRLTHTNITVQLTGLDGNAFAIIGAVRAALAGAGFVKTKNEFTQRAAECESYDELLRLAMEFVEVE